MSLMLWDKKKTTESLMRKRKEKGGPLTMDLTPMKNENVKDAEGIPNGKHLAAQDMIGAFHEKSPEKLMTALENFMDFHSVSSDDDKDPRDNEEE